MGADNLINFHKWQWRMISKSVILLCLIVMGTKKSLNSKTFKSLNKEKLKFINFNKVNIFFSIKKI